MGIVGAVLFYCAKHLAMFALGFGAGLIIALMLSGIVDAYVDESTATETWFIVAMWSGAVLLGIICGCIVLAVQRILFVLLTSILGSYLSVASVDYLIGDGKFSSIIINAVNGVQNDLDSWVPVAMFVGWIILAIIGIIVQFGVTSKGYSHRKRSQANAQQININYNY